MLFRVVLSLILALATTGAAVAHSPPTPDLNGDGEVNVTDLLLLLGAWGDCNPRACPADLNSDGQVNVADLLQLLSAWGPYVDEPRAIAPGMMYIERTDSESIVVPGIPWNLFASDFSMVAWLRKYPSETVQSACTIQDFAGETCATFQLGGASENEVRARMLTSGAGGGTYDATTYSLGTGGVLENFLAVLSWEAATNTLQVHAVNDSSSGSASITVGGDLCAPYRISVLGDLTGSVGCWAVRPNELLALSDAEAIFASRDPLGPIRYGEGASLAGIIAGNTGVIQNPTGVGVSGNTGKRIGSVAAPGDYLVYRVGPGVTNSGSWFTARSVAISGSPEYAFDDSGFFQYVAPDVLSGVNAVESDALRMWAYNSPQNRTTIATNGNSRNVRQTSLPAVGNQSDAPHGFAGNQHNGFLFHRVENCGANLNIRPTLPAQNNRQPGFENDASVPTTGDVDRVDATSDFTRAFWNSVSHTAIGPGRPVRMMPRSTMVVYADPIPGSDFLTNDDAWNLSVTLLKYPGSTGGTVQAVESNSKWTSGSPVGPQLPVTGLDTTRFSHTFSTESDAYDAESRTLVLHRMTGLPQIGELIRTPANALAEIESVEASGPMTTITLRHPFDTPPSPGDELLIGPFDYVLAEVHCPVSNLGYRGIHIEAIEATADGPLIVGAQNIETAEGGDYFRFVQTGWGGHGATPQLDESFSTVQSKLLGIYGTDAVVVFDPYQFTEIPKGFPALAERCLEGSSVVEVSFVIGQGNVDGGWHEIGYREWAFGQDTYPAVCVTDLPIIGDRPDRVTYSGVQDSSHPSTECYERVMIALSELIKSEYDTAAATTTPSDSPDVPPIEDAMTGGTR